MREKEENQLSSIILLTATVFSSISLSFFLSLNDPIGVVLFTMITFIYGLAAIYIFYISLKG